MDTAFLETPCFTKKHFEDKRLRDETEHSLDDNLGLEIPRVLRPDSFLLDAFGAENSAPAIKMLHGTTTLGFRFDGGVIIAVDSRASSGTYIASQEVRKVIEINPFLLGTMAGGAADCLFWERYLGMQCRLHELRNKERISVAGASKLLAGIVYRYKGMGLSMGTMVAGWDKTGPRLFYVDSDGTRMENHLFSVGSGATFAYGVLDSEYRKDLTVDDAVELGTRAIFHATHRDAASGGLIMVYHVTEKGWTCLGRKDMMTLYDKYMPPRGF